MKLEDFKIDATKFIAELTGQEIRQPAFRSSLTENVTKFLNLPLGQVPPEGLRLLLVQNFNLDFVVPAAICCLAQEPYAGGDLEDGALMRTLFVLVNDLFWKSNKDLLEKAMQVLRNSRVRLNTELSRETDSEERSILLDIDQNFRLAEAKLDALT